MVRFYLRPKRRAGIRPASLFIFNIPSVCVVLCCVVLRYAVVPSMVTPTILLVDKLRPLHQLTAGPAAGVRGDLVVCGCAHAITRYHCLPSLLHAYASLPHLAHQGFAVVCFESPEDADSAASILRLSTMDGSQLDVLSLPDIQVAASDWSNAT